MTLLIFEMRRRGALAEYELLKKKVKGSVHNTKWHEDVIYRQFAASYSDAANIEKAVLRDLQRHFLSYDQA